MPVLNDSHEANLYRTLVKDLRDYAIFCINPSGLLASWNAGVERTLGYREEEFLGQPFDQLFTPEDRERGIPKRELEEAKRSGRASDERWHLRKDGSRLYVEGIVTPAFDQRGQLQSFTKVMRDHTMRWHHEEQQRDLTLRLAERAHALDLTTTIIRQLDGTITDWSVGAATLYGWTREEAEGLSAHELLRTKFPESLQQVNQRLLARGEWQGELTHITRTGVPVSVMSRWVLHQRADGSRRVIEVNLDVSEQKRMRAALEQANEELSLFAYGIAHDLQSPLRGMSTSAELLYRTQDQAKSEWQSELTGRIIDSSRKLHQLVQGLLVYATTSEVRNDTAPVALSEIVERVKANLHASLAESGAEIIGGELPVVQGHSERLLQLFQNLIGNGVKYSRPGVTPRVEISAEPTENGWLIRVRDNGVGIESENLVKIFAPLQRLHGAEIDGSGLGLAICKRIVEAGGGTIWATSEIGTGSTFHLTLRDGCAPNISIRRTDLLTSGM